VNIVHFMYVKRHNHHFSFGRFLVDYDQFGCGYLSLVKLLADRSRATIASPAERRTARPP